MKFQQSAALAALVGLAAAEVPQEQSHRKFLLAVQELLQIDNPFEIVDPVFGLLGAAAAAEGAGLVTNLDCLQQVAADTAFTNAKAAGDIDGQANALLYRALERNTLTVGEKSLNCNETAVNPEIAVIVQHQDPASDGAADENKAIALNLAQQLFLIGADPLLALEAGTFEPGEIGDPTAAGNTCNDETDDVGCIFTEGLLVDDASAEEIDAAVAEVAGDAADADADVDADADAAADAAACEVIAADEAAEEDVDDVDAPPAPEGKAKVHEVKDAKAKDHEGKGKEGKEGKAAPGAAGAAAAAAGAASGTVDVQNFAGDLGGPAPPVVSSAADRPFEVNGATFLNEGAAIQRSCAIQKNACANAANSGDLDVDASACDDQEDDCLAAASLKKLKNRKFAKIRQANNLDFGDCADPTISFEEGLDGRQEAAFIPSDREQFSQGSALNINIISNFICSQLGSACDADEGAISACEEGQAASQGLQGQAAADAFNSALGF